MIPIELLYQREKQQNIRGFLEKNLTIELAGRGSMGSSVVSTNVHGFVLIYIIAAGGGTIESSLSKSSFESTCSV